MQGGPFRWLASVSLLMLTPACGGDDGGGGGDTDPATDTDGSGTTGVGSSSGGATTGAGTGGTTGFVIDGEMAEDQAGKSLAPAGDVNGDGIEDILVGAPDAPVGDAAGAGRAYVVFGRSDATGDIQLSDVAGGNGGFAINGEVEGDGAGTALAPMGDLNGDGMADFAVSAPFSDTVGSNSGRTYVVFGKSDGTAINLADVAAGTGGYAVDGVSSTDHAGISLGGGGDVDGDGTQDLIIGADRVDVAGTDDGRVYVVPGKSDTTAVNLADIGGAAGGFHITGENADDFAGRAVASAGDVNGDGLADVIVGAPFTDQLGDQSGMAYVVFGKGDGTGVNLADVFAEAGGGFAIAGAAASDRTGAAVAGVGDVNGDGLGDVVVGAPFAGNEGENAGRAYLVHGKADPTGVALTNVASGNGGFVVTPAAAGDATGWSAHGGFDINNDGMSDFVIGSPTASHAGNQSGRVYVIFGRTSNEPIDLGTIALSADGAVVEGMASNEQLGAAVAIVGDVNADGYADFAGGAALAPAGDKVGRTVVTLGGTNL